MALTHQMMSYDRKSTQYFDVIEVKLLIKVTVSLFGIFDISLTMQSSDDTLMFFL